MAQHPRSDATNISFRGLLFSSDRRSDPRCSVNRLWSLGNDLGSRRHRQGKVLLDTLRDSDLVHHTR